MKQSLRSLVRHLVDYAGLFPPAGLSMEEAVRNYAAYRESADAFALARFVVPVARLDEFTREATPYLAESSRPWKLSALAGNDIHADVATLARYDDEYGQRVDVDAIEMKASSEAEIVSAASLLTGVSLYFEIPPQREDLLPVIVTEGGRAKIRTGGITADAFPNAQTIVRFIFACFEAGATFKATAGLHHPLRCDKPLTYETNAPVGTMHGYINVFLAASAIPYGMTPEMATELLMERDPSTFRFEDDAAYWRDQRISTEEISEVRERFAVAFGSCSFEEPLDDLRQLGWFASGENG